MRLNLAVLTLVCLASSWEAAAGADPLDGAEPIYHGVRYLHQHREKPRPLNVHVVAVDLKADGIRFGVTPPNPKRSSSKNEVVLKRTSYFAREAGAQVAVNGTFFSSDKKPWQAGADAGVSYLAVYDGEAYSGRRHPDEVIVRWWAKGLSLWVTPGEAPWKFEPGDGQMALGMGRWALLLRDGLPLPPEGKDLHPRTAVGLDRDAGTALLVVVDGRQKRVSEGVSLRELAQILAGFGAHTAINLDGGGSTTMVIQQPGGKHKVVNRPSDFYPLCVERPVGTHLAVFAEKLVKPD